MITRDFGSKVDVLVSPTTPTTAQTGGDRRPLAICLSDLCTTQRTWPAAAMACRAGCEDNLPVGLQIMAPAMADDRLYRVGAAYEAARDAAQGGPLIDRVPQLEVA